MERVIHKTKTITTTSHIFHCDECGRLLGSSDEHEDGWYQSFGAFDIEWYTPKGWYQLEKCLCKECRAALEDKLCATLEELGFKPKKY